MSDSNPDHYSPRSPLLAAVASFFFCCLGQIYVGRPLRAIFYSSILLSAIWTIFVGELLDTFFHLALSLAVVFGLLVFFAAESFILAKRTKAFQKKWYNRWYIYILWIVLTVIPLPEGKNYYEAFRVPSMSSRPAIEVGDHLIVSYRYFESHEIKRGDIVVYTLPENSEIKVIKRVVGLPEETIEIVDTKVLINGSQINEPYARWERGDTGNFASYTIPSDSYFLLGDNRDRSRDSRYYKVPAVSRESILGKVLYIYWSPIDYSRIGLDL